MVQLELMNETDKLTYNPSTGTLVSNIISTDTISEKSNGGVTVDGVLLKDSTIRLGSSGK